MPLFLKQQVFIPFYTFYFGYTHIWRTFYKSMPLRSYLYNTCLFVWVHCINLFGTRNHMFYYCMILHQYWLRTRHIITLVYVYTDVILTITGSATAKYIICLLWNILRFFKLILLIFTAKNLVARIFRDPKQALDKGKSG